MASERPVVGMVPKKASATARAKQFSANMSSSQGVQRAMSQSYPHSFGLDPSSTAWRAAESLPRLLHAPCKSGSTVGTIVASVNRRTAMLGRYESAVAGSGCVFACSPRTWPLTQQRA